MLLSKPGWLKGALQSFSLRQCPDPRGKRTGCGVYWRYEAWPGSASCCCSLCGLTPVTVKNGRKHESNDPNGSTPPIMDGWMDDVKGIWSLTVQLKDTSIKRYLFKIDWSGFFIDFCHCRQNDLQLVKFCLHQATERHQSIKAAVGDVFR